MRFKKLITVLFILAFSVGLIAQNPLYIAYDYEALTISNSSTPFTAGKVTSTSNPINAAAYVVFTVNCASGTTCILRFTVNGTTPTTTVGMRALYGDTVQIIGRNNVINFKGIRETSTDVIVDTTYFRK